MPGRWLYTVGLNPRAARIGRVPVDRVIAGAYLAAGLMAGVTAVLLTARLGSASANMGADALTLDIIAACVVGGVSTFGGVGRAYGAVFGAIRPAATMVAGAVLLRPEWRVEIEAEAEVADD